MEKNAVMLVSGVVRKIWLSGKSAQSRTEMAVVPKNALFIKSCFFPWDESYLEYFDNCEIFHHLNIFQNIVRVFSNESKSSSRRYNVS